MKQLIIGGARSGKSRYAQQRAESSSKELVYLATAESRDSEMARRIEAHQASRDARWQLWEEPVQLGRVLLEQAQSTHCIVVDCLTLWLSNCLEKGCWEQQRMELMQNLDAMAGDIIFVGNEVGSGIVPMGELSRRFVDEAGWLHQELAQRCDAVHTVIAGLPLALKETDNLEPTQQ